MRRQFVAVVAANVISAGMTMNTMASGHAGLRHSLGYGRTEFAHGNSEQLARRGWIGLQRIRRSLWRSQPLGLRPRS